MDKNMRIIFIAVISFFILSCGSGSSSSTEDSFQFKNVPEDLTILD